MSGIGETWRQKFSTLSNAIRETADTSELQGLTALGMLKMLDYQLSGQYPRVGLNTTPFSSNEQQNAQNQA